MCLGHKFFTPEEAALEYARKLAASSEEEEESEDDEEPMTAEEAIAAAQAEGLTLEKVESVTGFKGVVSEGSERRGTQVFFAMHNGNKLGDGELSYETAEEAALALARHQKKIRGGATDAAAKAAGGGASGASGCEWRSEPKPPRAPPKAKAAPAAAVRRSRRSRRRLRRWRWSQSWCRCRGGGAAGRRPCRRWQITGCVDEWYDAEVLSYDASKKKKKFKVRYTEAEDDGSFTEEGQELAADRLGKAWRLKKGARPKKAAAAPKKPAAEAVKPAAAPKKAVEAADAKPAAAEAKKPATPPKIPAAPPKKPADPAEEAKAAAVKEGLTSSARTTTGRGTAASRTRNEVPATFNSRHLGSFGTARRRRSSARAPRRWPTTRRRRRTRSR